MASMDVFRSNAFSMTSLTGAVERIDYLPSLLGDLGIFTPRPVRTRNLFVDRQTGALKLISSSPDGAPPEELERDDRDAIPLKTARLGKSFTLYAHELADVRETGSDNELKSVQKEYSIRMEEIRQDMEFTHEFHRLGALQGILLDADGTTVIYDYFTEFGVVEAAAISFELDVATTDVRGICHQVKRSMWRSSKGAFGPSTMIHALAGDDFYDALINHPTVRETFLNYSAAATLRQDVAWESFPLGPVTFHNYQGSDDNSTVAVAPTEAKFFPVGARNVFVKAMAPYPTDRFLNTLGRDVYAFNVLDPTGKQEWTRGELFSLPLYFCQRPEVLRKATLT